MKGAPIRFHNLISYLVSTSCGKWIIQCYHLECNWSWFHFADGILFFGPEVWPNVCFRWILPSLLSTLQLYFVWLFQLVLVSLKSNLNLEEHWTIMSGGCIGTKVVHLGSFVSISIPLFSLWAYGSDSASCLFCNIALGRAAAVFSLMWDQSMPCGV